MTIKIEVQCDGGGCCNTKEIEGYTDLDVEHTGWYVEHTYGGHYCGICWPKVKIELAQDQAS